MIKINLLSPSDKQKFKEEKNNHFIMDNFYILFIIQIVFVAVFFFVVMYLNFENMKIDEELKDMQTMAEVKEINIIEKELSFYGNKADFFSKIKENHPRWTIILKKFSDIIPDGIKITNISIIPKYSVANSKNKKIEDEDFEKIEVVIMGVSKARKNLLVFEDNLRNFDYFIGFEVNPKNYDTENFKYTLFIK